MAAAFYVNQLPASEPKGVNPLQIYLDRDLSRSYTGQLLWRDCHVGRNEATIYLYNRAPFPLLNLSLITPPLPKGCVLTWNCQNYTLQPEEVREATLTVILSQVLEGDLLGGRFYIHYATEEGP